MVFAEKKNQAPKNVFFAHAWAASNPHNPRKIDMWIDVGTWNIVFPNNWKKTEALAHAWTASNAVWLWKGRLQETEKTTYWSYWQTLLRSNTLTITLQEPCLQGILLSDSLSFALAAKGWV